MNDLFAEIELNIDQKNNLIKNFTNNQIIADLVLNFKPDFLDQLNNNSVLNDLEANGGRILYEQNDKMDLDAHSLFIKEQIVNSKQDSLSDSSNKIEDVQMLTTSYYTHRSSSELNRSDENRQKNEETHQNETIYTSTIPTDPSIISTSTPTTTKSVSYPNNPQFVECINSCGTDHDCVRTKCLSDSTYFG